MREKLKNSQLNPFSDTEDFKEISTYLKKFINFDDDYDYDDSHSEDIYKAIKRLRLKRDYYDRVGFMVF